MLKKTLLTISLLLPFAAMSGLAQAGSTITDKSYWPNEAHSTAYRTTVPSGDWRSARGIHDTNAPVSGGAELQPARIWLGLSGWTEVADDEGAAVLIPDASLPSWRGGTKR